MAFARPAASETLQSSLSARANNFASCIIYPEVEEGTQFVLKAGLLKLLPSFHGLPKDDPHMHLRLYLELLENIIIKGMSAECVKLRLFTFTLKDRAKSWFYSLPANSITTWDQLQEKFLLKFFSASKSLALKKEILAFSQKPGESFHEAWDRYLELYMKCPYHGLDSQLQMLIFYDGLNAATRSNVNASAGGSLVKKTAREAYELYEMLAANSQQWSDIASIPITSQACVVCSEVTHDVTQCPSKAASPELKEEYVNSLNTFNMPRNDPFSSTYNPGWKNHPNFGWEGQQQTRQFQSSTNQAQPSQTDSKVATLEKMMERQQSTLEALTQLLQNQNAAIVKLEVQLGQLAIQVNERERGRFPSQPEPNPRYQEQLRAVRILRSGKSYDNTPHIDEDEDEETIRNEMQHAPLPDTAMPWPAPDATSLPCATAVPAQAKVNATNANGLGIPFAPSDKPPRTPPLPFPQ